MNGFINFVSQVYIPVSRSTHSSSSKDSIDVEGVDRDSGGELTLAP